MIVLQAKLSNALWFQDSVQGTDSHLPKMDLKWCDFCQQVSPQRLRRHHDGYVPGNDQRLRQLPGREPWRRQRAADVRSSTGQRGGAEISVRQSSRRYKRTLKHTVFYFSGVCDPVMSLCSFICPSRSESAPGCGFCRTIWGVFAQRLRVHRGLRKGDECRSKCLMAVIVMMSMHAVTVMKCFKLDN